jgi:phosphoenolpyruvate-protein kinase (PTS system EI component)
VGGALGLQGARLYGHKDIRRIVEAQLNAIDILSRDYNLRILLPFLVRREELQFWLTFVQERISNPIKIGAMVETPAAGLDFVNWLDLIDFTAIGTNDLMQCLFAADRDQPMLSRYLDPYAPLLYRFLRQMARDAGTLISQTQICGVLSQLPGVLPILIGLGYRAFSVDAALIPYLAAETKSISIQAVQELAQEVCDAKDTRQVCQLLNLPFHPELPFLSNIDLALFD